MNQKLIKFITQNCTAGPTEKSLSAQLHDQKAALLKDVKEFDEAMEFLKKPGVEEMLTEFMEATEK